MNTNQEEYYKHRAGEYEKIYQKPERQNEILQCTKILQQIFRDKDVREIACGTGFWTERIAQTANSIFATDINQSVLDIAQKKNYANTRVSFAIDDIFFPVYLQKQEILFGGFIWSHIKLEALDRFLDLAEQLVLPGGTIVFMDNNYVADSSRPTVHTDEFDNTYQTRHLENGSDYLIVKNFPTEDFIKEKLNEKATNINFINLQYYWVLSYIVV